MIELILPTWIYPLIVWEIMWKSIAMWYSARNNQIGWFLACLLLNTVGILPVIYLAFFQPIKEKKKNTKKSKKK